MLPTASRPLHCMTHNDWEPPLPTQVPIFEHRNGCCFLCRSHVAAAMFIPQWQPQTKTKREQRHEHYYLNHNEQSLKCFLIRGNQAWTHKLSITNLTPMYNHTLELAPMLHTHSIEPGTTHVLAVAP
jgi:hypothetical protein